MRGNGSARECATSAGSSAVSPAVVDVAQQRSFTFLPSQTDPFNLFPPSLRYRIMGIYIPTAKRDRLLKYKYSSTDLSLTSVRFHLSSALSSFSVLQETVGGCASGPKTAYARIRSAEIHPQSVLGVVGVAFPEEHGAECDYSLRTSSFCRSIAHADSGLALDDPDSSVRSLTPKTNAFSPAHRVFPSSSSTSSPSSTTIRPSQPVPNPCTSRKAVPGTLSSPKPVPPLQQSRLGSTGSSGKRTLPVLERLRRIGSIGRLRSGCLRIRVWTLSMGNRRGGRGRVDRYAFFVLFFVQIAN
jgi:hypothetical protein